MVIITAAVAARNWLGVSGVWAALNAGGSATAGCRACLKACECAAAPRARPTALRGRVAGELRCPGNAGVAQPARHAVAVGGAAVLAHLPLADQRAQFDLDADDRAQHRRDIVVGRVGDRPRLFARGLVSIGQARHERAQPRRVVDRAQSAAALRDHVVPGRHDLAVLGLARVEARRDVGLRTLEHHQRIAIGARFAPHRVRARDVRAQDAGAAGRVGIEHERHRVRGQLAGRVLRHQHAERMLAEQGVQHLGAFLYEMGGQVHGGSG
jgi:hypothetical protein